jgi:hypothetical protein
MKLTNFSLVKSLLCTVKKQDFSKIFENRAFFGLEMEPEPEPERGQKKKSRNRNRKK